MRQQNGSERGERRRDPLELRESLPYLRDCHRHLHHVADRISLVNMTNYKGDTEMTKGQAAGRLLLNITRGKDNAND